MVTYLETRHLGAHLLRPKSNFYVLCHYQNLFHATGDFMGSRARFVVFACNFERKHAGKTRCTLTLTIRLDVSVLLKLVSVNQV